MSNLGHAMKNRMTVICATCSEMACGDHRMENCPDEHRWCAIRRCRLYIIAGAIVRRRFLLVSSNGFVSLRCMTENSIN